MAKISSRQVSLPATQQTPYGADPYAQAEMARQYSDMLRQRSLAPIPQHFESTGQNIGRGMTQLAQALLARRAAQQANTAQTSADAQTRGAVDNGIEKLTGAVQINGMDGEAPTPLLGGSQNPALAQAVQDRLRTSGQQGDAMHAALDNVDPRVGQQVVAQALLQRAMPPPNEAYTLGEGQKRFVGGQEIASVAPKETPNHLERKTRILDNNMAQDYNFNPTTGEETPVGSAYKHKDPSAAVIAMTAPSAPVSDGTVGMLLTGMPLTAAIPGFGAAAVKERGAARDAAIARLQQDNPGMNAFDAGQELARRNVDYIAGKSSQGQLTKMLGATRQAADQLDFNIDKTSEVMAKMPSTDISPVLNAIMRGAEKWTGDPNYASLFYYMHGAALESARMQSGGQASVAQLNEGAAQRAQEWANIGLTPAMWADVAKSMKAEGAYRVASFQNALGTGRDTGNNFLGKSPPSATAQTPAINNDPLGIR